MSIALDQLSEAPWAILVSFAWGEGYATRNLYAAWTDPITIGGDVYLPLPELDVKLGKSHGGAKDETAKIIMSRFASPASTLARPFPHSAVRCAIGELDPRDPATLRQLFFGEVTRCSQARVNRDNVVELEVSGIKGFLPVSLGVPADSTCVWRLGDKACGINVAASTSVGSILEVNGAQITVNNKPPGTDARWFHRGYVERDGVRIAVREANHGVLTLTRVPPPEWVVGVNLRCVPGCDKTIETCRARWNNEEFFGGMGYAMPSYHPLFEVIG